MVVETVYLFLTGLVMTFGYLGLFVASILGSASVIFPVPVFIFIVTAGGLLNPFAVGIIAGVGSAIGELVAYVIGFEGRVLIGKKVKKKRLWENGNRISRLLIRIEDWMLKRAGFFVIFLFALTPLPDDIIGLIAGSIKYDIKKFFVAILLGKIILSLILAYAGFYGMQWILGYVGV